MRLVGHSDQGGKSDGVQIMVHRGYAYIGHIFSKGFSVVSTSAIPPEAEIREARRRRRPTPGRYISSPHDDLLLVIHNKDMFAQA